MMPDILVMGSGNYISCVERAGGFAVESEPTNAQRILDIITSEQIRGVLLAGGSDVSPALYGEKQHPEVYGVNKKRDAIEMAVLSIADQMKIPVLGICRGAQIMNVWAGGSLHQDIGRAHWGVQHKVRTGKRSLARLALGVQPRVRSFHHQEINRVGKGFNTSAWSEGISPQSVEAIERFDGLMLGCQFHPEMSPTANHSLQVFDWFVSLAFETDPFPVTADALCALDDLVDRPITKIKEARARLRVCRHCSMMFDKVEDRADHEKFFHQAGGHLPQPC